MPNTESPNDYKYEEERGSPGPRQGSFSLATLYCFSQERMPWRTLPPSAWSQQCHVTDPPLPGVIVLSSTVATQIPEGVLPPLRSQAASVPSHHRHTSPLEVFERISTAWCSCSVIIIISLPYSNVRIMGRDPVCFIHCYSSVPKWHMALSIRVIVTA